MEKKDEKNIITIVKILNILEYADDYLSFENILKKIQKEKKSEIKNAIKILKREKIIGSARGNKGGYFLTETIKDMTISDILNILEINKKNIKINNKVVDYLGKEDKIKLY